MCFRPPTVEGAQIKCPKCGSDMPMSAPKCPKCGATNAANSNAAPPVLPKVPGASKPKASNQAKAPATPGQPPQSTVSKATEQNRQAKASQPITPSMEDTKHAAPTKKDHASAALVEETKTEPATFDDFDPMDFRNSASMIPLSATSSAPSGDTINLTISLNNKNATASVLQTLAKITQAIGNAEQAASQASRAHSQQPSATPVTEPTKQPRTTAADLAAARTSSDEREIQIPQVGGQMRAVRGVEELLTGDAPEVPTGPGFEEAPDISNTGNYFVDAKYNNV